MNHPPASVGKFLRDKITNKRKEKKEVNFLNIKNQGFRFGKFNLF